MKNRQILKEDTLNAQNLSSMEKIHGDLLYEVAKYAGPECIILMETFSRSIRKKLHMKASAFQRMLRKTPNLVGDP